MCLAVASTWDGQPVPGAAVAQVELHRSAVGVRVVVDAPFHGDPAPPGPPGSTPGLWDFEVVEVFFLADGERYTEVELGPHGHHLVLQLEGVRRPVRSGLPLDFTATVAEGRWRGVAWVPASHLPAGWDRLNAYAIQGLGANRCYLAWRAPGGDRPDFHRLEAFGRYADEGAAASEAGG